MKMYDDKYIVVTGGAGFIGSGVVRYLNDMHMDKNIVIVDDLKNSTKWKNLVGKRFQDIVSKHELFNWLKGRESEIEAFIHLGACSDTTELDAGYLLSNNYHYTVRLAEYALKHGHRFIYASSAATYGAGENGFSDEHSVIESLKPINMYAYSKQLFDIWLLENGLLDRVVGLKYFNIFGPNEQHKGKMMSVVPKFVETIQRDGMIKLFKSSDPKNFADGEQQRDFLYVKDAVRMTCEFLESDASGIYNVGSGITTTWNKLASTIFKILNKKEVIEYVDMPKELIGAYQNYTCAKMDKIISVNGIDSSSMSIEDSVEDYIKGYILKGNRW